ncbi:hypothetical protein Tco_0858621 [Tanacetum coccineum]|uniref:Uncharacterized protein n=1 Tax=Tanacetum coccineum TaxID=301880 RepID=A0ABQ5BDP2_9ASTR
MQKTRSVTVSVSQYAVFNGTEYAVLNFLNEYAVLDRKMDTPYPMEVDRKLDTPYPMKVDTPYRFIDQNNFSDLGCKTGDSRSEGLQFCWNLFQVPRSVGKQLAKLCEAKSLESLGFRELLPFVVPVHPSGIEVIEPKPLTLEFKLMLEMEEVGESGVKNANLVSFKNSDKSSSFIFFEKSSALGFRVPSLPLKSPVYHEPSVASVVSASVVDRSIGIDNPHLSLGSQADLWCIEHLRYYFLGCLAEHPTFMGHSNLIN